MRLGRCFLLENVGEQEFYEVGQGAFISSSETHEFALEGWGHANGKYDIGLRFHNGDSVETRVYGCQVNSQTKKY